MTASGPLVVKDAVPPPYDYDEEIILQIGDFYPEDDNTMESLLTGIPSVWPGDPMALMINGYSGRGPFNYTDPSCSPWTMNVEMEKTYRVRVIGTTALSLVLFGIDNHDNLTIIETDNSYVYPVETPYMQVDTGQRFSFLLATKRPSGLEQLGSNGSFWIQFDTRGGEGDVAAWGILNYTDFAAASGSAANSTDFYPMSSSCYTNSPPTAPVLELPTNVTDWLEYSFQNPPLPGYDLPPDASEVTRRIFVTTYQTVDESSEITVMGFDGRYWVESPPLGPVDQIPYLVEILQNGTINGNVPDLGMAYDNGGFDPYSRTYPVDLGEVIEIVWENKASIPGGIFGAHPMHAHGGPYWDMGSGSGSWTSETHEALLQSYGENGMPYPGSRRDTTMLYNYDPQYIDAGVNGWRVWRIRVTERNAGVWMMHVSFSVPPKIMASLSLIESSLENGER